MGDHVVFMGEFPGCPARGKVWQGAWKVDPVNDYDTGALNPRKILPGWNDGTWGGYTWNPAPDPSDPTGSQKLEGLLIGPGTGWVGPMTKEQAMQITWRIKEWKLEVVGAAASATAKSYMTFTDGSASTSKITLATSGEVTNQRAQNSEAAAIVCGSSIFTGKVTGVDPTGGGWAPPDREMGGINMITSVSNGWSVNGGQIAVDIDKPDTETNRYYVQIEITFTIGAYAFQGGGWIDIESHSNISLSNQQSYGVFHSSYMGEGDAEWIVSPASTEREIGQNTYRPISAKYNITEPSGGITIKLGGGTEFALKAQKIKLEWTAGRGPEELVTASASVSSLTLSPYKWWPYAKEDGSPAYDEDTGAPL